MQLISPTKTLLATPCPPRKAQRRIQWERKVHDDQPRSHAPKGDAALVMLNKGVVSMWIMLGISAKRYFRSFAPMKTKLITKHFGKTMKKQVKIARTSEPTSVMVLVDASSQFLIPQHPWTLLDRRLFPLRVRDPRGEGRGSEPSLRGSEPSCRGTHES